MMLPLAFDFGLAVDAIPITFMKVSQICTITDLPAPDARSCSYMMHLMHTDLPGWICIYVHEASTNSN